MNVRHPKFDDATRTIEDATAPEWMLLRIIQAGARLSARWGYRGFGACCRMLQILIPGRVLTITMARDTTFTFPLADGYWSMLLGGAEIYEPEIDNFLKGIAADKYTLVDCGANYGYWSVLASGMRFGSQRVIAVEPSAKTFAILQDNAARNGNRFACIRNAIGARSGVAHMSGRKHEARAITPTPAADSETVEMLALDSLIESGHIAVDDKVVIKLDVEGLEIAALAGSRLLLERDSIVICEDHGSDRHHTVSRHIINKTALKLYCYNLQTARFETITDVVSLDHIKRFRNRGYNVFATSSPYWEEKLRAHCVVSRAPDVQHVSEKSEKSKTLIGSLAKGHVLY